MRLTHLMRELAARCAVLARDRGERLVVTAHLHATRHLGPVGQPTASPQSGTRLRSMPAAGTTAQWPPQPLAPGLPLPGRDPRSADRTPPAAMRPCANPQPLRATTVSAGLLNASSFSSPRDLSCTQAGAARVSTDLAQASLRGSPHPHAHASLRCGRVLSPRPR